MTSDDADGLQVIKDPSVLVLVSSEHGNGRTCVRQSDRDAATDAAVPSRHEGDSTREVEQCVSIHRAT